MRDKFPSDDQLRRYLISLIDTEIDKPDADMELINECNSILDSIEKGSSRPSPEIKEKKISELLNLYRQSFRMQQLRKFSKTMARICAVICICIGLTTLSIFAATAISRKPINEVISEIGEKILSWTTGETEDIEGLTFIKNGEATKYNSIGEALQAEGIDIYYPTWLPEGVYVESFIVLPKGNGEDKYIIKFNTEDVLFSVERINSENNVSYDNGEFEKTLVNGIAVYYNELNGMHKAEFSISSYSYSLIACDRISLENIIIGLTKG